VLPSGPADELETCGLMFTEIIHMARKRLWIVSPYFVPDDTIVSALQLAALRGVDVRLMIPERADHRLVYMASFAYLEETLPVGIRIFRYRDGFLHQKAFLMDDVLAGVGTANRFRARNRGHAGGGLRPLSRAGDGRVRQSPLAVPARCPHRPPVLAGALGRLAVSPLSDDSYTVFRIGRQSDGCQRTMLKSKE